MTSARAIPARFDDSASSWERALYAFLAAKERRSGSRRTVESYSRMLQDFFGRIGRPPDTVTSQDVFTYAHGIGLSGREPVQFNEVQHIRAERVHWSGRRSVARVYPLSRRAFCFYCGGRVAGDTGGQKNRRRMRHSRTGLCAGWRSHHAHLLEGQLGEFMAARISLPADGKKRS